jgi:hypothetical protein
MQDGCIKTWSSTQSSRALSSGEAEYYAMVKGAAEGLGVQALARDLGVELKVRLGVDSTAAKSIAGRMGLGKVRHIELRLMWLQDVVEKGRIELYKVKGLDNPADLGTKPKMIGDIRTLMEKIGIDVISKDI